MHLRGIPNTCDYPLAACHSPFRRSLILETNPERVRWRAARKNEQSQYVPAQLFGLIDDLLTAHPDSHLLTSCQRHQDEGKLMCVDCFCLR
jgi:hypothetical protein